MNHDEIMSEAMSKSEMEEYYKSIEREQRRKHFSENRYAIFACVVSALSLLVSILTFLFK